MIEVVVKQKRLEAEGIVSLELVRRDGGNLPPFSAGSHIDVHLGDNCVRQYSLCNQASQRQSYLIAVLRDPASRGGSITLHDKVMEGDMLTISEPRNLFPLAHEARHSLLLAGGIGVTPLLCMAEHLSKTNSSFELHYCARSQGRAAFVSRLKESSFADRVVFHFDDGAEEQRFNARALLRSAAEGTHLYVCGPTGFMDSVLETASGIGWNKEYLHREYFAAASPAEPAANAEFEVKIASTGAIYKIANDKRVTDVLAENGISIPTGCNEGLCGTCITRVLEGEPDHRDYCLTDAERAANSQFLPCCSRAKSPLLVLDI